MSDLPNVEGVRDPAAQENLRFLQERSLLPKVGDLLLVTGDVTRPGWLPCPTPPAKTPISRAQYPEYMLQVGTVYGAGNGTTTVDLPPMGGTEPLAQQTWIVRVK
jgi:microcystin-dependent protein